jgi:hypothetical protein
MFGSAMPRQVGSIPQGHPDTDRLAVWYEVFGIDSIYDYDPVWEKCREVKIAPTFHSPGSNQALRNSPTNFTYNHIGHFADAGHAAAKGILWVCEVAIALIRAPIRNSTERQRTPNAPRLRGGSLTRRRNRAQRGLFDRDLGATV